MVVEHTRRHGIRFGFLLGFGNEGGEGGEGGELAIGEKLTIICHAKGWRAKSTRICRHCAIGIIIRLVYFGCMNMFGGWCKILATMLAFGNDCH